MDLQLKIQYSKNIIVLGKVIYMRIVKLNEDSKKNILEDLLKRSPNNYDQYADSVNEILSNVKENGDKAILITQRNLTVRILTLKIFWLQKKKYRKRMIH